MIKNNKKLKIILTGTFDLLHSGHFNLMYRASMLGEIFIILRPDDEVLVKKGKTTYQNNKTRLENVSKIIFVKDAIISGYSVEETLKLIDYWGANAIAVGSDNSDNPLINEIATRGNIRKIALDRTSDISSTYLRENTKS